MARWIARWSGVGCGAYCLSTVLIAPALVVLPTAVTRAWAVPATTVVAA